jgi:hypothetical protein
MYLRDVKRPQSGLKHMRGKQKISARDREQGIIITLVAVFMLGVIGAMAALSIDVVTLYTARSEAQLAADSAALAAARVIANSGATSDSTGALLGAVEASAQSIALQVAEQNQIASSNLTAAQVSVIFGTNPTNPTVKVTIQKNDLPTFFARIWGRTQFAVAASATAEAYNSSGTDANGAIPTAPICVKPWLLPNMDPSNANPRGHIFNRDTGGITARRKLLGWSFNSAGLPAGKPLTPACGNNCLTPLPAPSTWNYYPGQDAVGSFPHPTQGLPTCSAIPLPTAYQDSIDGCIATPIACNSQVNIDASRDPNRNTETGNAVNCLTHATPVAGSGDTVTSTNPPSNPFDFVGGSANPITSVQGQHVLVSDSLVTVPVFDVGAGAPPYPAPTNPVTIIGFVQLFLNPDGIQAPTTGNVNATVINMAGCGINAATSPVNPIIGNGASPVAVRLITPP